MCNQLAASKRIRRESIEKTGKRRKIHNFPADEGKPANAAAVQDQDLWRRCLAGLIAATGRSEESLLDEALYLLAMKVLKEGPSLTFES